MSTWTPEISDLWAEDGAVYGFLDDKPVRVWESDGDDDGRAARAVAILRGEDGDASAPAEEPTPAPIDAAIMDVLIVAVSRGYQCGGLIEEAVAKLQEGACVAKLRDAIARRAAPAPAEAARVTPAVEVRGKIVVFPTTGGPRRFVQVEVPFGEQGDAVTVTVRKG